MSNPLSSVAKYLTSIWKSDPPKTGHTFSEQKDSCHLATTQLVATNLNQVISNRLPGCSLCKATLEETKDGKLSFHSELGETIIFSDEKTMDQWLADKRMVDIWQIEDLRGNRSEVFYKLQREDEWGYDIFETRDKLFDQLREDYGVLWKLEDQGKNQTSYVQFKTGIFGNCYVDVNHEDLTFVANSLKLEGPDLPTSTSQTQEGISWGQGIAACVLGGLLLSAGRSWSKSSTENSVRDAIAMMRDTVAPAMFKTALVFQGAAMSNQKGGMLPTALLAASMLLPKPVKSQTLCPQPVGSYVTPWAGSVAVSNEYAYLLDYYGLRIIDVSNVANPVLAGSYTITLDTTSVAISGKYVYIVSLMANQQSGFYVIDVSDAADPLLTGSCGMSGVFFDFSTFGKFAYMVDGSSFLIVDISDATNPTVASSSTLLGARNVVTLGKYAYAAILGDPVVGLQIFDVSDAAHPTLVSTCSTPSMGPGLAISGNYVLASGSAAPSFQIIDVGNVLSPTLVGSCDLPSYYDMEIAVSGNYALVADYTSGLQIIDISNVTNPKRAGYCTTPDTSWDIAVYGKYAYIADNASGLQIIDWNIPCHASTNSANSTNFITENPLLWFGLLGGGGGFLCLCMIIGGTVFIIQRRRKSSNHKASSIGHNSEVSSLLSSDARINK